jgi:hypothetical protein
MTIPEENEEFKLSNVEKTNYGSTYTVINLGSLYLIFVLMVIEAILLFITKPICWFSSKIKEYHNKFSRALYFNSFLRLILEASLEISISTLNNIVVFYREGRDNWL